MRTCLIVGFTLLALATTWLGCGGDDLVVGGMLRPTPSTTQTPTCVNEGEACTLGGNDCCSGLTCQADNFGADVCG